MTGSEFAAAADLLVALKARANAAYGAAQGVKAKVEAWAVEDWHATRAAQWRRPEGLVSLIVPDPYALVSRPETLCAWLDDAGHGRLCVARPVVTDDARLVAAVSAAASFTAEDAVMSPEATAEVGTDLAEALLSCVDVRREPVADWSDHVQWQATDDGTMVSDDGEPIPGARWVVPDPTTVQVRPGKPIRETEARLLAGEGLS